MISTAIIGNVAGGTPSVSLPTAAWDVAAFLANAKSYGSVIGGGLITLLGLIIVIVAVVFIAKKFLGSGQGGQEKSWVVIVIMIIVGGALLYGGITFVTDIASGGQKTISDLGGGFIVLNSTLGLAH